MDQLSPFVSGKLFKNFLLLLEAVYLGWKKMYIYLYLIMSTYYTRFRRKKWGFRTIFWYSFNVIVFEIRKVQSDF